MITNPGASRTLSPAQRGFVSVVGIHDNKVTDADFNLAQALQSYKTARILHNQAASGALTYKPFSFNTSSPLTFAIPAYDVLINGEVVTIGGNNSADLTQNIVTLPPPIFWSPGSSNPQASLYIVFLEFWYQRLNVISGMGFIPNANGTLSVYPNGCVNAVIADYLPNDTIDPFMGKQTTERVQLQWAIRVQSIDLGYDFTTYAFGLDQGATAAQTVWGQANQTTITPAAPFQFTNLGSITGDTGVWRSGDGNTSNALGTLDGYSYAMPLAVVFQRNTGVYSAETNPFGSASASSAVSGTIASLLTDRYDGKFADSVFPSDVIDTRSTVSLTGFEEEDLLRTGFVDVISGRTRLAIARGEVPGNQASALGSLLDYTITVSPNAGTNTDTVGNFDGFRNGFSAADQTFYTSQAVTVDQKSLGQLGSPWNQGDSFTVSLPPDSLATIEYVQAQGLVTTPLTGAITPVLFLSGQVTVAGLGTKVVTVSFAKNLTGTTYDPGLNPIYVTLGVEYPANSGVDLVQTPAVVFGGKLLDTTSGQTLPVYGVSDYEVRADLPVVSAQAAFAYNPNYSDVIFGTRVQTTVAASAGVTSNSASGNPITTFSLTRTGLNGNLTGLYVVAAADSVSGSAYNIVGRSISGTNFTLQLQGTVPAGSTLLLTFLTIQTAQLSYNAPVRAVTAIEETVLAGQVFDPNFRIDPRISVISVTNNPGVSNTLVLGCTGGLLSGISGDDVNKLIWVQDALGYYDAVQVASAVFANSFVTLTVPGTVNLTIQNFFVACALLPAFASTSELTVAQNYVPYQGEGVTTRDYEILHTEDTALVTTNGTGAAPLPGLRDVYPYDRELPVSVSLPSQATWSDATLLNQPVQSFFDSNFVAKAFENVQHTFEVPAHTNDFIEPIADGKRKSFRLSTISGGRGYAKAVPHMGFAIQPLTPKSVASTALTTTLGSITLYIDNVHGNDANDGLTVATAFLSLGAALASLPSVLHHPVSVQLIPTAQSYNISSLASQLAVVALGDGVVRSAKSYALGILCFGIQESGRLVISAQAGTSGLVTIDASTWAGFGDGPTSAFFIENSRVIFNQIEFKGFTDPAITGLNADVEFVDCAFTTNQQAASFTQGSTVVLSGGTLTLGSGGTGFVLEQSEMDITGVVFAVAAGATPGAFFVAERNASLAFDTHTATLETNVTSSTLIAQASLNSSIETATNFQSAGCAVLSTNSVLLQTVSASPFSGITKDSSSTVTTGL